MDAPRTYQDGSRGTCPHCGKDTRFVALSCSTGNVPKWRSDTQGFTVYGSQCMLCLRIILWGTIGDLISPELVSWDVKNKITFNIWPQGDERPVPKDVPGPVSDTFKRANRLLGVDDVAAAAFARTCLEKLFDEQKVPRARLDARIKTFLDTTSIPGDLRNNVDLIRQMGNFIHLNESIATGDVVEISPEEAGFALDILSALFEDLYVRQKEQEHLRSGFVAKIKEVGKGTIGPPPAEEENSAS